MKTFFRWGLRTIHSKWLSLLFLLPFAIYFLVRQVETDATRFIIPYLPDEGEKPFAFYQDFLLLCLHELLWLTFFLFLSWFLFVFFPLERTIEQIGKRLLAQVHFYVPIIIGISFITSIVVANYTLDQFPNSADEYVYLYQAETLSEGKLWENSHPLYDFFRFNHIGQKDGISIGRFPPGWPIVLSTAFIFQFPPYLVNVVLGLISLIVFYRFATDVYGRTIAIWSLISLALSAYFIFNSASYFSHTSSLLYALGFVYGIYLYEKKRSPWYGVVSGLCLGLLTISRYYTAALIFLPLALFLLYRHRLKAIPAIFWIGLGGLPFLVLLFWYNYSVTGNGFLPVTMWTNSDEALGFVHGHTFMKGIEHTVRRSFMFLYWCSPALFLLYFVFLFQKAKDKSDRWMHTEDYIFVLLIIGYFFYYHIGGNQYGPRFFLEGLPFLILFVVRKLFLHARKWAFALFGAGLIYGVIKMPMIIAREHRIVYERLDLYRQAQQHGISNAVILISSTTGVIRPMPTRDLTRNGTDYTADVIYALDKEEDLKKLMGFYPGRSFYRYIREPEKVEGKLERLR
jgi:hypothetical protein